MFLVICASAETCAIMISTSAMRKCHNVFICMLKRVRDSWSAALWETLWLNFKALWLRLCLSGTVKSKVYKMCCCISHPSCLPTSRRAELHMSILHSFYVSMVFPLHFQLLHPRPGRRGSRLSTPGAPLPSIVVFSMSAPAWGLKFSSGFKIKLQP